MTKKLAATMKEAMAMDDSPDNLGKREQQILCGLFLSKYDQVGLEYLGFKSFTEAFNALGYGLGARPASIKNYRDELDPYLSAIRRGWHQRPLREHCKRMLDEYSNATLVELGHLIKRMLWPSSTLRDLPGIGKVLQTFEGAESSFAKRIMTGRAAEAYFLQNYESVPVFSGLAVTDTTQWGCGFDFKLSTYGDEAFTAVEVKGMRTTGGQIQLTELEYAMAEAMADRFYLFVVRNFSEKPYHSVFRNPLCGDLPFTRLERRETRVIWQTNLTA